MEDSGACADLTTSWKYTARDCAAASSRCAKGRFEPSALASTWAACSIPSSKTSSCSRLRLSESPSRRATSWTACIAATLRAVAAARASKSSRRPRITRGSDVDRVNCRFGTASSSALSATRNTALTIFTFSPTVEPDSRSSRNARANSSRKGSMAASALWRARLLLKPNIRVAPNVTEVRASGPRRRRLTARRGSLWPGVRNRSTNVASPSLGAIGSIGQSMRDTRLPIRRFGRPAALHLGIRNQPLPPGTAPNRPFPTDHPVNRQIHHRASTERHGVFIMLLAGPQDAPLALLDIHRRWSSGSRSPS